MEKYLKLAIIVLIAVFLTAVIVLLVIINHGGSDDPGGKTSAPHVVTPAEKVGDNIMQMAGELLPPQAAQQQMKKYVKEHGPLLKPEKKPAHE